MDPTTIEMNVPSGSDMSQPSTRGAITDVPAGVDTKMDEEDGGAAFATVAGE